MGEAKSDEGIEERKEDSAPPASQNYQDAACAVGAGPPVTPRYSGGGAQNPGIYQGFAVSMWLRGLD